MQIRETEVKRMIIKLICNLSIPGDWGGFSGGGWEKQRDEATLKTSGGSGGVGVEKTEANGS